MKVLALVLVALVLTSTLAIQARSPSLATKKKIEQLSHNKRSWSSIIMSLAMLQNRAGNPVAELISAIEKIIADLDVKQEKATSDYDQRTGEHQNEVKRLNREIDNAATDVANTDAFLKEVLRPMKQGLEEDIARLQSEIAKTRIFLEEAAIQRRNEHDMFAQKIVDIDGGLAGIAEAFEILNQLIDGGASFAQIAKAKNHLQKMSSILTKNVDAALIKALIQLATSSESFTNQEMLRKVMDMLHGVSESLKQSQAKLTADENQAQIDYERLVVEKENEIKQMEAETIEKQGQLASTEKKIADSEAFIAARTNDGIEFKKALDNENTSYEEYCKVYEDLMKEFQKEQAACREALDILGSAEFAGYINDRMNQKVVIGTNQGSGVTVN